MRIVIRRCLCIEEVMAEDEGLSVVQGDMADPVLVGVGAIRRDGIIVDVMVDLIVVCITTVDAIHDRDWET